MGYLNGFVKWWAGAGEVLSCSSVQDSVLRIWGRDFLQVVCGQKMAALWGRKVPVAGAPICVMTAAVGGETQ